MKVIAATLLALVAFGTSTAAPHSDLSDEIKAVLEMIKAALPDNLSVTNKEITIPDNSLITGSININEISLSGVKDLDYSVTDGDVATHVDYTGSIADIIAVVDVNLKLSGLIDVDSNVRVDVDLQKTQIQGSADVNDDDSEVTDFDLLITLGGADILVKGVVSDEYSQELSEELTKEVPEIVNQITKAIEEPSSRIIKFILNLLLHISN